jgi:hypothetical protein
MIPFLKQVARHYFRVGDISKSCFIFPNRRSQVFFFKYLSDEVRGGIKLSDGTVSKKPVTAPESLTINDFFFKVCGANVTDRVKLLLDLYDCYKILNPKHESLDDFIFWGDVILADFDDTDKYLADPRLLFTNISDYRAIRDSYSYLSDKQRNAITKFISHFKSDEGLYLDPTNKNPNVKEKFLSIWEILYPLYVSYKEKLRSENEAYEGMVYRELADILDEGSVSGILEKTFGEVGKFVFVGLNALNRCEKKVMGKMKDAGLAEFCWDYSSDLIRDRSNRSSFFMEENIKEFPQSFVLDDDSSNIPEIKVISVPSSVGQVKLVPEILKEISSKYLNGDMSGVGRLDESSGADCAIVLPDETLLMPLLNTIPPDITSVNVTMGYPMSGSSIYSLMSAIASLQIHLRKRSDGWYFYHKQVLSIFSNGLFLEALGDDKSDVYKVRKESKYYIPQSDLDLNDLFRLLFRPVVMDTESSSAEQIDALADYQIAVINSVASAIKGNKDMLSELDFARRYYNCVNRLKSVHLSIKPVTYFRLLQQLTGTVSVPFRGEPLKGLQIMGPLETRALDFSNIILLSCNEGVFPHKSAESSFIPPELRKGFDLPTYENQDIVWAYYFYRMLQRSVNVWLLYDSRTEGLQSGEESRYIKQLEYHFEIPLKRWASKPVIKIPEQESFVPKTKEDIEKIRKTVFSASSVLNYLSCPAKFYYADLLKLKTGEEISESLDMGMLGNVFHNTMYALYSGGEALAPDFQMDRRNVLENLSKPLEYITADYIRGLLKNNGIVKAKIRSLILGELNSVEVSGRNLVMEKVIYEYIVRTLRQDLQFMSGLGTEKFRILGLEMQRKWNFNGFDFIGYIDRMDSFVADTVRIVDYKTGKVLDEDVDINDDNASDIVKSLFADDSPKRPKIALQLFLYDRFSAGDSSLSGKKIVNAIYSVQKLFNSEIRSVDMNKKFCDLTEEGLKEMFEKMTDISVPFRRTEDLKICEYCDFKTICGR